MFRSFRNLSNLQIGQRSLGIFNLHTNLEIGAQFGNCSEDGSLHSMAEMVSSGLRIFAEYVFQKKPQFTCSRCHMSLSIRNLHIAQANVHICRIYSLH